MNQNIIEITLQPEEKWWGGNIRHGDKMPYTQFKQRLLGDNQGNQSMPLLISNHGRIVYSEGPFTFEFAGGRLLISEMMDELFCEKAGETLKDAYQYFAANFAPPSGKIPDELLFTQPQYNSWIELTYNQNEQAILEYAEKLIAAGYPPGVLMIDDTWQENYGVWEFSPRRFSNPKAMVEKLHAMGFKVMLWVCPFVSADSPEGRMLAREGLVILEKAKGDSVLWADTKNRAAPVRWWNGISFCLDLSHPEAVDWFKGRLDYLQREYGVDGFKFDAGDARFYDNSGFAFHRDWNANDHMESFARFGLEYELNELRACWKLANKPIAQRLRDKKHRWEDMKELIPGMIAQGLVGYSFSCPDMIGGGEYQSFQNLENIDQELFVRSAQLSALMPMMQFSAAPHRVLDKEHREYCLKAAELHSLHGQEILECAKQSAAKGEPIVRSLEYNFPGNGYAMVNDQFMLGEDILVIPVINKGQIRRVAYIPEGRWVRQDMTSDIEGPCKIELEIPLSTLCWFRKKKNQES